MVLLGIRRAPNRLSDRIRGTAQKFRGTPPTKNGGRGWPTRSAVGLARDPPPRSTSNKSASINAHWLNSPAGRISRSAGTRQSKRDISSNSAKPNRSDPSDDNRRAIENGANTNGQHAVRELTRLRARKSHGMVGNSPPRIKPRACETRGTHQTLHLNTHFGLSSSARSVFADSGRHNNASPTSTRSYDNARLCRALGVLF